MAELDRVVGLDQLRVGGEQLRRESGYFVASGQSDDWCAPAVIICTGVIDHYPHFEGWEEYVGRSMFWCITCDGYGCRDARVVVVGGFFRAPPLRAPPFFAVDLRPPFFAAPFLADLREDDLRDDFFAAFLPPLFFFAAILSPGW
mgnify:CR=1 FL=1